MHNGPQFRPVNPILGSRPSFGPIPADLVLPWMVISFLLLVLCQNILKISWTWTILFIVWGNGSWWILTGSKPYRFLCKFMRVPKWSRHYVQYTPFHSNEAKK